MAANYTTTIDHDVADVLTRASVIGRSVVLPNEQLDRALYVKVNKVLESAGGKWNRKAKAHVFVSDAGIDAFTAALTKGSITDERKALQQFFTPPLLAERIVAAADIMPAMTVLEPSAGNGALALMVRRMEEFAHITCVEFDVNLVSELEDHGFDVHCADFMGWTPELRFDRVVMNPPFQNGQDVQHITRAYGFLRPGGRLVSVAGAGIKSNEWKETTAFRTLVHDIGGTIEDLPEGAFAASGTMVRTVLVTMEKP